MQRTSKVQEFNGTFEFFINGSKKWHNRIAISIFKHSNSVTIFFGCAFFCRDFILFKGKLFSSFVVWFWIKNDWINIWSCRITKKLYHDHSNWIAIFKKREILKDL